jgi:alpha-tubulin suppressor-like RCC1 family protein
LWVWGSNEYGKLGNGASTAKTKPVPVKSGIKFTMVAAGSVHSTAIDEFGNLWTWGYNKNGRLGDGTTSDKSTPMQVKSGTKFKDVSAGSNYTLAIDEKGKLWAWGNNDMGQLGDGTAWHDSPRLMNADSSAKGKFIRNR